MLQMILEELRRTRDILRRCVLPVHRKLPSLDWPKGHYNVHGDDRKDRCWLPGVRRVGDLEHKTNVPANKDADILNLLKMNIEIYGGNKMVELLQHRIKYLPFNLNARFPSLLYLFVHCYHLI